MIYRIPFNRPTSVPDTARALLAALDSGKLSGDGPFTRRCEAALERITGARRVLLTSSCTAALEMSAILLGGEPGGEVIVPSFTFVSTANAFATHGFRPVFADCRSDTFNIDERGLERLITPRTRAIVTMHYGGVACDMDRILEIAGRHRLAVIEDNAHGLFGKYKGRPLGTFGPVATQSFHETKNLTCGEGGAIVINDASLIERAEIAREKGTDRSRFFRGQVDKYTWVDIGSNYLCSEFQAAALSAQLDGAADIQAKRRAIWDRYDSHLREWAAAHGVQMQVVPALAAHPSHLFALLMPSAAARKELIDHLASQGILAVFHYVPLHLSPVGHRLGGRPGDCPVAEDISERLVRLPLYTDLTADDQARVIDCVKSFVPATV
jgi:dTDP-4-amino-4,6-dideoxygalactose transaminase